MDTCMEENYQPTNKSSPESRRGFLRTTGLAASARFRMSIDAQKRVPTGPFANTAAEMK